MNRTDISKLLLASAALCAAVSLFFLSGCKGNTSAAAVVEKSVDAPPHVQAFLATADPRNADPLSAPVWTTSRWLPLTAPLGSERTTATTYGSILYDNANLYIAFVSQKPSIPITQDMVSVFLDSSAAANGSEIIQITVNADGLTSATWIRDAEPPTKPKDDGTPDIVHPLSKIPAEGLISGLYTRTGTGTLNGLPVWTATVAIPLKNLPLPLRTTPAPGANWKFNLLRTTLINDLNTGLEQLQANLSPVYVGQQPVAPYRMATLDLVDNKVTLAR